jgi:hypothetical protein
MRCNLDRYVHCERKFPYSLSTMFLLRTLCSYFTLRSYAKVKEQFQRRHPEAVHLNKMAIPRLSPVFVKQEVQALQNKTNMATIRVDCTNTWRCTCGYNNLRGKFSENLSHMQGRPTAVPRRLSENLSHKQGRPTAVPRRLSENYICVLTALRAVQELKGPDTEKRLTVLQVVSTSHRVTWNKHVLYAKSANHQQTHKEFFHQL